MKNINTYGTHETNPLPAGFHEAPVDGGCVEWTHPGLYITRLRLLSDPGYQWWDVSYCFGEVDGRKVTVRLPFADLPKRGMKAAIIEHAKRDGVYAKRLGIFDNISTLC